MEFLKKASNMSIFLTLLIIGVCVFIGVFFNGFVGDDKDQIYNYALVGSLSDLPKVFLYHHEFLENNGNILTGYYRPFMLLFFYTTRVFFGLNPFFYHTPQIILGIVNSFLVFILFKRFIRREVAFLCSLILLIHPINQEVMAYVSNIQDILFFLFGILGLLILTRAKTSKEVVLGGAAILASLLSKETGILFIFITLLYVWLFKKGKIKMCILTLTSITITYLAIRLISQGTSLFWIEPSPIRHLSLTERLLHTPLLFFYYIKTFILPINLTLNQQWIIKEVTFANFFLPLIFTCLFLISATFLNIFLFIKHSKISKTILFFSIWFIIGIIPHLQIVPLDVTISDRWFYFSSVGILGVFGVFIQQVMSKFSKHKLFIFSIIVILLFLLAGRTFARNMDWKDAFTLYTNDSNRAQNALIENNLGDEYFKMGDFNNAKIHFNKAISINPNLWIAFNNLGILEEKKGNYSNALSHYRKALQQNKRLPIYENIARTLVFQKNQKEAIEFIKPLLTTYPISANLWLILSLAEYDSGDLKNALISAKKSYELLPDPKTQNVIMTIENEILKKK